MVLLCPSHVVPKGHRMAALPATRERRLSMLEIGEKEREYLFKELYKLKSNYLMSTLRSQSPLEYPQTQSPSFPLTLSGVLYLRKRNKNLWFFFAQAMCSQKDAWSQKDAAWMPCLGLNPSTNLPLLHHFQRHPQLATAASIPLFFQLYWVAMVSPGRCGPVVGTNHLQALMQALYPGGVASQLYHGLKLLPSPWLKAWPQLFNISMKPVKTYRYVKWPF